MTEGSQEGEWQHLAFVYDLDKTLGFSEGFSAAACYKPHGLFSLFVCVGSFFLLKTSKEIRPVFFGVCVVCFVFFGGVN